MYRMMALWLSWSIVIALLQVFKTLLNKALKVDILQYCPFIRFSELHISSICAAIVKALAYLHSIGTNLSIFFM